MNTNTQAITTGDVDQVFDVYKSEPGVVEVRYRHSSRGRNSFLLYVNDKFVKSFRTALEAARAKAEAVLAL